LFTDVVVFAVTKLLKSGCGYYTVGIHLKYNFVRCKIKYSVKLYLCPNFYVFGSFFLCRN